MAGGRVRNVDACLAAANVVDKALRMAVPNPSARAAMGLEGVSEKLREPLGWHLWLRGGTGPYALELAGAVEPGGSGVYLVRCFPGPGEPAHGLLSARERRLLASDAFDSTGTPAQARPRTLAPDLFAVGLLAIAPEPEGPEAGLFLELVSRPGWTRDASWRVFDFLACMLAAHYRLKALSAECGESEDGRSWRLACAFAAKAAGGDRPRPSPWMNPAWWDPARLGVCDKGVEYSD